MKQRLISFAKFGVVLLLGVIGGIFCRSYPRGSSVHAEERPETATCMVGVPKSWGEFRGASAYGLAFQDENGTLRFLLHPSCGNLNSPTDTPYVDLEILRR